ncbi:hypothetical protein GUJ93_ZPchr0006g41453 [Zizania palustris]|uniref:Uncharacterized protein n=1 Tax=Zizania palustris TaxID=103762 RepID=A0A8J5SFB2_ZIZPA|nr:hypothetical protein GUJ93_ZPchr0006g41453 [Zizania palustris]
MGVLANIGKASPVELALLSRSSARSKTGLPAAGVSVPLPGATAVRLGLRSDTDSRAWARTTGGGRRAGIRTPPERPTSEG